MKRDGRPLVLHVIHHLVMGGMENGLVNLINGLPAKDFRHAIACIEDFSDFRARLQPGDVDVYALHRSQVGVARVRQKIFQLCRELRPRIVHSRNLSGLDALLPARLAGVRFCLHGEHGWDMGDLFGKHWKALWLRRMHAPLVTRYVAVSEDLVRYLVDRVRIAPHRITHICNGVDTDRFSPGPRDPGLFPEALRGDDMFVVGTVGRLQVVKNQEVLLRAFAALLHGTPMLRARACVVVVGDGPLRRNLEELAHSLGIADRSWFPGARADVPAILRNFDVFVLPSFNEGISNTILEAMASGLPVIASRVGGNVEIVDANYTGRLFDSGDVPGLAQILSDYACHDALVRAEGIAARCVAIARFGLPQMIEQYQLLYASLLTSANRTGVGRADRSYQDAGERS